MTNINEADAADLLQALSGLLGPRGVLTEPADTEPFLSDWRGLWRGRSPAVVRPATVAELAGVVALCAARGVPIVPQGGNTGLMGGAVPSEAGDQLVVSLGRLAQIRAVDPIDMTITLEAGVPLRAAQEAAREAGCMLPLSIASEGSAQIGGVLATNAGGNNTLRYGNARDLVLGLEVVLPDGRVWDGLRALRKDNTGYCLRQLFVGAEGTLGIIAAAVLKLVPLPRELAVAFCAVPSADAALALYGRFQRHDPAVLQAFEYMSATGMGMVLKHIPGAVLPFDAPADHYVLVELATPRQTAGLRDGLEAVLGAAFEAGLVSDAVIAESEAQRRALWRLREEHTEAQKHEGVAVRNDVSVPVSAVAALLRQAIPACQALIPGVRIVAFGHVGDGNIHFNLLAPEGADQAPFLAQSSAIMETVNAIVRRLGGSFSAEHGIGRLKTGILADWRAGPEIDLMARIKHALDPQGLMNPGKVLASGPGKSG